MCKVISVVNQKGGVGKTTTTVNVGIGLAREGKKVLLIDADPQGSLTASLGYEEPDDLRITLATIMMDVINEEEISLEDGILHHQENVDFLPANIELSALEVTMGNVMSREMIMKEYIDAIRSRYDYILIDCMPSLGMMTINALVSSDSVLIPVQAAYLPMKGLQQLIKTILTVKKRLNRKLAIEGILLTMVDFRTNYARDIASRVHTTYGSQIEVFENVIPMSVKAAETSAEGLLPSEKAFAYKMKQEAMKHQGSRTDLTLEQNVPKFKRTTEAIADGTGESSKQIQRYIRLTELIPELLDLVDNKKLQFTVAVDISYIDKEVQEWIYEYISDTGFIKPKQIAALRNQLNDGPINQIQMLSIFNNCVMAKKVSRSLTFSEKKLTKYFPDDYTAKDMEQVIESLLEKWMQEQSC